MNKDRTYKFQFLILNFLILLLLVTITTNIFAKVTNWTQQSINDLHLIHDMLVQNTPQYVDKYPKFMRWLDVGLKKSTNLAKQSNTEAGYYYSLAYYVHGFHNEHINTYPRSTKMLFNYAGLLLKYANGKYVVKYADSKYSDLPPVGSSKLIKCGSVSAQKIIDDDIIPYLFTPKLEASYNRAANYLFFDANPFRKYPKYCTFTYKNHNKRYPIHWQKITSDESMAIMYKFKSRYPFKIELFGKRGIWISIPTLFPQDLQLVFMNMLVNSAETWRNYNPIVFDVRGNGGGDSSWATKILSNLYGGQFLNYRISIFNKSWEQWRISKRNILRLRKTMGNDFAKNLEKALKNGQKLYPSSAQHMQSLLGVRLQTKKIPRSLFHNHIYFLTDNECASACLDFADYIYWLPKTTHIGLPTYADTPYIDVDFMQLPGGANFTYNIKVWRNRTRKANQPYIPKYRYQGDITDTPTLMKWVEKLYNQGKF